MRRRARIVTEICLVRPRRCAAQLVYCSVRDWTSLFRHRIKKYPDSPIHTLSDSLRIYFFPPGPVHTLWDSSRIYFFHSGERILFFSIFAVEFAGYVWTVAVWGKKKLRIWKYPDTCGRGLRQREPRHRRNLQQNGTTFSHREIPGNSHRNYGFVF